MSLILNLEDALNSLVSDHATQTVYTDLSLTINGKQVFISLSSGQVANAYVSGSGENVDEAMRELKQGLMRKIKDFQRNQKKLEDELAIVNGALSDLRRIDPPPLTALAMEAE